VTIAIDFDADPAELASPGEAAEERCPVGDSVHNPTDIVVKGA
jgi:uncharacterized OsmC-like protein